MKRLIMVLMMMFVLSCGDERRALKKRDWDDMCDAVLRRYEACRLSGEVIFISEEICDDYDLVIDLAWESDCGVIRGRINHDIIVD